MMLFLLKLAAEPHFLSVTHLIFRQPISHSLTTNINQSLSHLLELAELTSQQSIAIHSITRSLTCPTDPPNESCLLQCNKTNFRHNHPVSTVNSLLFSPRLPKEEPTTCLTPQPQSQPSGNRSPEPETVVQIQTLLRVMAHLNCWNLRLHTL